MIREDMHVVGGLLVFFLVSVVLGMGIQVAIGTSCSSPSPTPFVSDSMQKYELADNVYYLLDRQHEICFSVIEANGGVSMAPISIRDCIPLLQKTFEEFWSE